MSTSKHRVLFVCIHNSARSLKRIARSFPDPSSFKGSQEEILRQVRIFRDEIEQAIKNFIQQASQISYWIALAETSH